jgi:CubicO group peptidase (beta-lactamase class C family)
MKLRREGKAGMEFVLKPQGAPKIIFMRNVISLILILMLAVSAPAQDAAMKKRLDAVIDRAIKDERIVGVTIVVAQNGKVVYRRTAGLSDREAKKPLRGNDVFRLASMTKLIVSVAALVLVDEGKLGLDDEVTKYLPDFRPKVVDGREPKISVRQLLTHTAGLNYGFQEKPDGAYHRLKVSDGLDDIGITLEENLRRIAAAPLLYEPGTSWNYSVAIDVLGAVVAKAGGASLPEVVKRKVTQPLKMNDTAFIAQQPARLVTPYADGNLRPVRMTEPCALTFGGGRIVCSLRRATDASAFPSGGAGMVGTIDDYFRFLEVLRNGGAPILTPETARLIAENAIGDIPVNTFPNPDAWGWSLGAAYLKNPSAAKTPQSIGTWQWGGVWGTNYFVDPQKKLTVICLTNTGVAGMVGEFPTALVNAVYGK